MFPVDRRLDIYVFPWVENLLPLNNTAVCQHPHWPLTITWLSPALIQDLRVAGGALWYMHIKLQPLGDTRFGWKWRSQSAIDGLIEIVCESVPVLHVCECVCVWEDVAGAGCSKRRTFAFNAPIEAAGLTGCVACGGFCVCPTCTQEITARHAQRSFRPGLLYQPNP